MRIGIIDFDENQKEYSVEELLKISLYILRTDYENALAKNYNENVYVRINTIYKLYVDFINKISFKEGFNKYELLSALQQLKDDIILSEKLYLEGNLIKAIDVSARLLNILENYQIGLGSEILYRGRKSDSGNMYKRNEMFHIPFSKRHLVSAQRYSVQGFPCLYMGNSIYTCWNELDRPDIHKTNYIGIVPTKNINLLDLCIPKSYTSNKDILKNFLILICSLHASNDHVFKQEYILPQLILNCIISKKHDKGEIWGIRYFSTALYTDIHPFYFDNKEFLQEIDMYINYVVPVRNIHEKDLCVELTRAFKFSASISMQMYQITVPSTSILLGKNNKTHPPIKGYYRNSILAVLEDVLDSAEKGYIDENINMNIDAYLESVVKFYIAD